MWNKKVSEPIQSKKELETERKELLKRIVALDCMVGDYTKQVNELYARKREIEFQLKNYE